MKIGGAGGITLGAEVLELAKQSQFKIFLLPPRLPPRTSSCSPHSRHTIAISICAAAQKQYTAMDCNPNFCYSKFTIHEGCVIWPLRFRYCGRWCGWETQKETSGHFRWKRKNLSGTNHNCSNSAGCPPMQSRSKASAAGFLRLRSGMTEMHFARLWRSNWERSFTCCTRFRKSRSEELKPRNKMSI